MMTPHINMITCLKWFKFNVGLSNYGRFYTKLTCFDVVLLWTAQRRRN